MGNFFLTASLLLALHASVGYASDGGTHSIDPSKPAYAVCGGQLEDYVASAFIAPCCDEGEGRAVKRQRTRLLRVAERKGWGVCQTPGLLWIGSGIDIDPEGGWVKPNIIKHGSR